MSGLRIQRRLLAVFLVLLACVLLPTALLLDVWVGSDLREVVRADLTRDTVALASELDRAPPANLPDWAAHLGFANGYRVTVIAPGGEVLADSDVRSEELGRVENHRERPEVISALAGQLGSNVRRSATVGKQMMYVAAPVGSPPHAVLRLALPLDQVAKTVGKAHAAVFVSGLFAFVLAYLLGSALSRWWSRPVIAVTQATRAMIQGDFTSPLPEPEDDELGDLLIALDTLRKQLAGQIEALSQEGLKLRAVLDGMTEGVALVQSHTITAANLAFTKLLGLEGTAEGRTLLEVARLPSLADAVEQAMRDRTEASSEAQVGGRSIMIHAHPLGVVSARQAVVVLIDMTETRRLERLRRDFVANASHELRTPVAAIVGVAETLAAGAADDPVARASFVEILLRHSERLSRLTADLLDIARLEGGYRPRTEKVPLNAVVEAVASSLRPRAEARQIQLTIHLPEQLAVTAERPAAEQILTNLVDNAIKYTAEGRSVTVSARPRGTFVELVVEDTGQGIPAEHLPRLFERFYRVDNARSRELGGTGLGLAIVKHLVLANGGEIRVESTVGQGSRFLVLLPRASL